MKSKIGVPASFFIGFSTIGAATTRQRRPSRGTTSSVSTPHTQIQRPSGQKKEVPVLGLPRLRKIFLSSDGKNIRQNLLVIPTAFAEQMKALRDKGYYFTRSIVSPFSPWYQLA
jgi:hypothetical protein